MDQESKYSEEEGKGSSNPPAYEEVCPDGNQDNVPSSIGVVDEEIRNRYANFDDGFNNVPDHFRVQAQPQVQEPLLQRPINLPVLAMNDEQPAEALVEPAEVPAEHDPVIEDELIIGNDRMQRIVRAYARREEAHEDHGEEINDHPFNNNEHIIAPARQLNERDERRHMLHLVRREQRERRRLARNRRPPPGGNPPEGGDPPSSSSESESSSDDSEDEWHLERRYWLVDNHDRRTGVVNNNQWQWFTVPRVSVRGLVDDQRFYGIQHRHIGYEYQSGVYRVLLPRNLVFRMNAWWVSTQSGKTLENFLISRIFFENYCVKLNFPSEVYEIVNAWTPVVSFLNTNDVTVRMAVHDVTWKSTFFRILFDWSYKKQFLLVSSVVVVAATGTILVKRWTTKTTPTFTLFGRTFDTPSVNIRSIHSYENAIVPGDHNFFEAAIYQRPEPTGLVSKLLHYVYSLLR